MADKKPTVELLGKDGNAYAVLGRCKQAAKKAGWSEEEIKEFVSEAMKGDYNYLLATCMDHFDIE